MSILSGHRIISIIIIGAALSMFCTPSFAGRKKDVVRTITVVSTNDVHGKYFDSLYVRNGVNETSYANVSTYVNDLRKHSVNPILIDVGDNLQGDNAAYFFNNVDTSDFHVLARIMNYMHYDAVVVGNHDVETGHPVYDRVRKELRCRYLAANAIRTDGSEKPYFDTYSIVYRDGVKAAVIGFTNPNIESWISPKLYSGMRFDSIPRLAQRYIDSIKVWENPELVVVAVHAGVGDGLNTDFENVGLRCAKELRGVDIVLASHDHEPHCEIVTGADGGRVALLDAGKQANYVGLGKVELTIRDGKVISKNVLCETVPMKGIPADTKYMKEFEGDFVKVKAFTNKDIGYLTAPMDCGDAVKGPSSYLHLLQTVMLEQTGADISFCAPISSAVIPAGSINIQDLFTLYPYENQLYVVKMTGEQIKNMLELSYNMWVTRSGPSFNFDSAEGIIYEVSRKAPFGQRVKILSMQDGSDFHSERTYLVAMTSYRASGGGDLLRKGAGIDPTSIEALVVSRYPEIREILYRYVVRMQKIDPTPDTNWKFVE